MKLKSIYERHARTVVIIALFAMIMNYQSCAPTDPGGDATWSSKMEAMTQSGRVLTVCANGCMYSKPSQILDQSTGVLQDGDIVEIRGGDYVDCLVINKKNITLRGIAQNGLRPRVHDQTCEANGVIVLNGGDTIIENLEISGSHEACVHAFKDLSANLTIRNSSLHDCDKGLLVQAVSGTVLLESSVMNRVTIGTADLFILRNSIAIDGHGAAINTRALRNVIECNTLSGVSAATGRETTMRMNVIVSTTPPEEAKGLTLEDNILVTDTATPLHLLPPTPVCP